MGGGEEGGLGFGGVEKARGLAKCHSGYKDALVPAAFPTALSIPFSPHIHVPTQAPDPHRTIRRGQSGKCLSATTGSHSLDASAALSHRPSDRTSTHNNDADEAPDVLAGRWRPGHAKTLDAGPLLLSF